MRSKTKIGAVFSLVLVLVLLVGGSLPAYAHHKDDHAQGPSQGQGNGNSANSGSDHDGDADSDDSTAYTEDNDTNDGGTPNNVEDDGDNKHPSGKDRSVEPGGSGTQGKAESNPDDSKGPMRYEGALGDDKPNGPGGTDLADQDGNNGCGNDDDFDDDNNGHCGGKKDKVRDDDDVLPTPPITRKLCPAGTANAGMEYEDLDECVEDDVDVRTDEVCPAGTDFAGMPMGNLDDCVLGTVIRRSLPEEPVVAAGQAVLPFTGEGSVSTFLIAGIALITAGLAALKVRTSK